MNTHLQPVDNHSRALTTETAAPVSDSAALMTAIARAAADPSVDVEKMERLFAMHERMQQRNAERDFNTDLALMQDELPSIGERGDANGRYKFALWEDINAAIKPALKRHGFALSFRTAFPNNAISVTGILSHRGGHSVETTITLPPDPSGNKPAVQAVASSVSYGKRYAAGALLNLTSHGEDDDAFAAAYGVQEEAPAYADWLAALDERNTVQGLHEVRAELVKTFGRDKIPNAIIGRYNDRLASIKGTP